MANLVPWQKSGPGVRAIESKSLFARVLRAKMGFGRPRLCGQKCQTPIFEAQSRPIGLRTSQIALRAGKIGIRGMHHHLNLDP